MHKPLKILPVLNLELLISICNLILDLPKNKEEIIPYAHLSKIIILYV